MGDGAARWLLAVGAAGAVILVWWTFVSPKAKVELFKPLRFIVELGVWAAAAIALAAAGRHALAGAFFLTAVVSGSFNAWR